MSKIQQIRAREILDSRGTPTVEVEVLCAGGAGRASAPSGASTGRHEAREIRDGDPNRYAGKGVLTAIQHIEQIIGPELIGRNVGDQAAIDRTLRELDGTDDLSRLGANAVLAVSMAVAQALAAERRTALYRSLWTEHACLPLPMVNMISGGLHAGRQIEFQDFLIIPVGAKSFRQAIEWSWKVHRALGAELARRGVEASLVADEGGFAPRLANNREALDVLSAAVAATGLEPRRDVAFGIDVAATHFYRNGRYWMRLNDSSAMDLEADDMIDMLTEWVETYPILSIEDGLAEDDWEGWQKLAAALGSRAQLVGDDLLTTNPVRLAHCIESRCANAILIKPNQIGTLTDAITVLNQARSAGLATIVSARSGETEDTTIADLAVATGAGQIKIGCIVRGERLVKYNQLFRIEEEAFDACPFPAARLFSHISQSTSATTPNTNPS